jgi:hypothetical protein
MNPANASPALTLFDADALILLVAVAMVLLLAAVGVLLSLRARTRAGAIAGVFGMLLPMAFLPIAVSLLSLLLTRNQTASSSWYLWLAFASVINLDWVFAMGTLVSGIVYFAIPGTHRARLLRTLVCLAVVAVVAVIYIVVQLHRHALVS